MKKKQNQFKIYNNNGIGAFICLIVLFSVAALVLGVCSLFYIVDPVLLMFGLLVMLSGLALSIWLCVKCIRNKTIINSKAILFYLNGQLAKSIAKNNIKRLVVVIVPFWGVKITHSIVLDDGTFVFKHPYSFTAQAMTNESYILLSYRKNVLKNLQREFDVPVEILDTCQNFSSYKTNDDHYE